MIINHLIPDNNKLWSLLLQLCELIEILTSSILYKYAEHILREKIDEYLKLLSILFPGSLKLKHHLLIHYPTIFSISYILEHLIIAI